MVASEITVIIPTRADIGRESDLMRAIHSVMNQTDVLIKIIIVVNGSIYVKSIIEKLKKFSDIEIIIEDMPSVINARYQGLIRVKTPYFAFLDDDDEYLQGSIRKRITQLERYPECILVASSGYRNDNGIISDSAFNLKEALKNPFQELSTNNWLTSCGCIFRSNAVSPKIFLELPPYHEWTYLAYKLLTLGSFCIVDEPCYVIHNSIKSLSKTADYSIAHADVFRQVLLLDLPKNAISSVKRRLAKAEHELSGIALDKGMWKKAVAHHARSLALPGGLSYLSYTRYLLFLKTYRSKKH